MTFPRTLSKDQFWSAVQQLKPGITKTEYEKMWDEFRDACQKHAATRASMQLMIVECRHCGNSVASCAC